MDDLTQLTVKQQSRLTSLAKTDPLAKVISWDILYMGPIVRLSNDTLVVITSGGQARRQFKRQIDNEYD